ncbi:response regulator receiver domain protein [Gemella bergeri ATCC 700627]|uniref:Response regulator receiver domain protein n=1 Tax=Gemella bergeri ATCC 700627 TaxID=1321820 RepID=U2RU23_9BACL|nr:response regulator transcription factor [Gemella bergeri]ERK57068.1 response regulator receiver domain protein [Gemella bergeri ATCC 700627]
MLKALIIEDDKFLAARLKTAISEKFDADVCYNGIDAISLIDNNSYDFIIADSILPGKGGIDILDYSRETKEERIPTIILSVTESTDEKSRVMKHRITEYLPRYCEASLINSTMANLLQRGSNLQAENKITYKNLTLDLKNELVKTEEITLNTIKGKYLELLSFFVINNNIVLEKEEIFDRVWGVDSETTINAIEVYISGLRKELRKIGFDKNLRTVRGVGYTFE